MTSKSRQHSQTVINQILIYNSLVRDLSLTNEVCIVAAVIITEPLL